MDLQLNDYLKLKKSKFKYNSSSIVPPKGNVRRMVSFEKIC